LTGTEQELWFSVRDPSLSDAILTAPYSKHPSTVPVSISAFAVTALLIRIL